MALIRPVALTGSDQAVVAAPAVYRGLTVRETSGSAGAVLRLHDNASAGSGTILQTVALAQGESANLMHPDGVWAVNGIYADVVSGAIEGSVYIA
ncbi:hypothetical protein [Sphaerisporangium sp. TRM90804]|uniref:hypothetical protein n=1 Tax=Sphaerisporangium sp. TRM90804 TaxID=3031113 RepID=UPI0024477809|nr:hypothetical protein [Sphaerisporangium sp. TRM90804]MDH2425779.1 hypothetical protein [Sphaerisporangium sp. TRM90804]